MSKLQNYSLHALLQLKAQGITPVQPQHISDEQRTELQACMVASIKGETAKERREAREVFYDLLDSIDPELIYDETLMYNGRWNYRTIGDMQGMQRW